MPKGNQEDHRRRRYGVVGGLGALAGADFLSKLISANQRISGMPIADISFEQRVLEGDLAVGTGKYDPTRRKFFVYNALKDMELRGIDIALVPCFVSHTFLPEILPEIHIPVVNIFEALRSEITNHYAGTRKIGVLTSTYVRNLGVFERELDDLSGVVYPNEEVQTDKLMTAIYGPLGVRSSQGDENCIQLIAEVCSDLVSQGAEIIVPGITEVSVMIDSLRPLVSVPILDSNLIYAEYALNVDVKPPLREFKLGVLGGVGPAATVDFMRKLVGLTQATRDQDHIKIIVEQNPQIPDRTANLIGDGDDPTISLLATCKRLEADEASAIAIPCNTAHAYVDRIQSELTIPIVNMLSEVVSYLRKRLPEVERVGLLATSGTVASGVYRNVIEAAGLSILVPDTTHQELVMQSIYGERGVKAGFTSGICSDQIAAAIDHLVARGAQAVVLGCTELPLIVLDSMKYKATMLIDPTEVLAARCVALAKEKRNSLLPSQ